MTVLIFIGLYIILLMIDRKTTRQEFKEKPHYWLLAVAQIGTGIAIFLSLISYIF